MPICWPAAVASSAALVREVRSHPPVFLDPDDDLYAVADTDLGHQAGEVEFHRSEADVEFIGDLGVGPPPCDCRSNFFLTLGQGNQRFGARREASVAGEIGEQAGRGARSDEGIALGRCVEGLGQ